MKEKEAMKIANVDFNIEIPENTTEQQLLEWLYFNLDIKSYYDGKGSPIAAYDWEDLKPGFLTVRIR